MLDDFGLFSDFGSKIFLNRKVFKESHVPNIEKYRNIEMRKMASASMDIQDNLPPHNILISGNYATGKTTALLKFLDLLMKEFTNVHYVYIDCNDCVNARDVYSIIYKNIHSQCRDIEGRGNTWIIDQIREYVSHYGDILIIALDDLQSFKHKEINNLIRVLIKNKSEYHTKIAIFAIHQTGDLSLDADIDSVFDPVEIVFNDYSYEQLCSILEERCLEGFYPNVIDMDLVRLIAKRCYECGNLRYGIKCLGKAGNNAENVGSDKILIEHI